MLVYRYRNASTRIWSAVRLKAIACAYPRFASGSSCTRLFAMPTRLANAGIMALHTSKSVSVYATSVPSIPRISSNAS